MTLKHLIALDVAVWLAVIAACFTFTDLNIAKAITAANLGAVGVNVLAILAVR